MAGVTQRGDRRNRGSPLSRITWQTLDLARSLKSLTAMSPIVLSAALRKHGAWQNYCVPRWKMFMASAQKRKTRRFSRLCRADGVKSRDEAETSSTKQGGRSASLCKDLVTGVFLVLAHNHDRLSSFFKLKCSEELALNKNGLTSRREPIISPRFAVLLQPRFPAVRSRAVSRTGPRPLRRGLSRLRHQGVHCAHFHRGTCRRCRTSMGPS